MELTEALFGNNLEFKGISEIKNSTIIELKSLQRTSVCPKCQTESRKFHSTYYRTITTLPINLKPTKLKIKVHRFRCENENCNCKVFSETLDIAYNSRVRTKVLDTLIIVLATQLSSEGTSRVLKKLGIKISNDTIDNLIKSIEIADNVDVTSIGVDDVAYRKGIAYNTVIYDMETHDPIALLDKRDGEELKKWLAGHSKVSIVARDRDSLIAKAISEILPDCVQVADRFHIMQNLLNRLKEVIKVMPSYFYFDEEYNPIGDKTIKKTDINRLNYDNSPVIDEKTGEIVNVSGRYKYSKDYNSLKKKQT